METLDRTGAEREVTADGWPSGRPWEAFIGKTVGTAVPSPQSADGKPMKIIRLLQFGRFRRLLTGKRFWPRPTTGHQAKYLEAR